MGPSAPQKADQTAIARAKPPFSSPQIPLRCAREPPQTSWRYLPCNQPLVVILPNSRNISIRRCFTTRSKKNKDHNPCAARPLLRPTLLLRVRAPLRTPLLSEDTNHRSSPRLKQPLGPLRPLPSKKSTHPAVCERECSQLGAQLKPSPVHRCCWLWACANAPCMHNNPV